MFSVTYTGMNFRPLCTANVWPTNSGTMVERRDQVLMTAFLLPLVMASTFLLRCGSTNGPLRIERVIALSSYWLRTPGRRPETMNLLVRLLVRVVRPLVFLPQGDTG